MVDSMLPALSLGYFTGIGARSANQGDGASTQSLSSDTRQFAEHLFYAEVGVSPVNDGDHHSLPLLPDEQGLPSVYGLTPQFSLTFEEQNLVVADTETRALDDGKSDTVPITAKSNNHQSEIIKSSQPDGASLEIGTLTPIRKDGAHVESKSSEPTAAGSSSEDDPRLRPSGLLALTSDRLPERKSTEAPEKSNDRRAADSNPSLKLSGPVDLSDDALIWRLVDPRLSQQTRTKFSLQSVGKGHVWPPSEPPNSGFSGQTNPSPIGSSLTALAGTIPDSPPASPQQSFWSISEPEDKPSQVNRYERKKIDAEFPSADGNDQSTQEMIAKKIKSNAGPKHVSPNRGDFAPSLFLDQQQTANVVGQRNQVAWTAQSSLNREGATVNGVAQHAAALNLPEVRYRESQTTSMSRQFQNDSRVPVRGTEIEQRAAATGPGKSPSAELTSSSPHSIASPVLGNRSTAMLPESEFVYSGVMVARESTAAELQIENRSFEEGTPSVVVSRPPTAESASGPAAPDAPGKTNLAQTGTSATRDGIEHQVAVSLAQHLRNHPLRQDSKVNIQLDPPELGIVRVEIQWHNDNAKIHIQTETPLAFRVLEQNASSLIDQLHGMQTETLDLDITHRESDQHGQPLHDEASHRPFVATSTNPEISDHQPTDTAANQINMFV